MPTTSRFLSAIAALGLLVASCGSETTNSAATSSTSATSTAAAPATTQAAVGDITVFAAASLTAAYTKIGDAFELAHPGTNVTFSFDASSTLVTQLNEGAPADVFASADQANMKKLTDAGGAEGDPQVFATNALQIIVEKGNPKHITGVDDLAQPGLLFVTCSPEVPIGKYTAQVLANAGVDVTPVSLEQNVKGIVTKVTAGEADAGIVYKTDVIAAADKADGVDIPAGINVTANYPIVATKNAPNLAGAHAFIEFVLGDQGQQILVSYGFGRP